MIIDTHCHLDDPRFEKDLDEVIARAHSHGVKGFIIPGADPETLPKAKEIAHRYENIFYAAGVHPYDMEKYDENLLKEFLEDEKCVAVGECGLDYYRLPESESARHEEIAQQKRIFIGQIELAKSFNKPLIVHIRDASDDSKTLLIEHDAKKVGGVLHCFNADEQLLELSEYGFYFGIGGVLTFKNAKKLPQVLPKIPKDRLLVETDAPYLTPHPHRGKRNEPWYIVYVVEKMADILGMATDEIEKITTQNAMRLFKPIEKLSMV